MTLPGHWRRGSVGELIDGIDSGKNIRCEERPPKSSEVGIVKISAVTWGTFDASKSKTVVPGTHLPDYTRIKTGDLLITRANTLELVGATVVVEEAPTNLHLSDKVLRLRAKPGWERWLNMFLNSDEGRVQIESCATGNQLSMRNIGQDAIRNISLPIPPLGEQRRIVARIEALLARTRRARADLERVAPLCKKHSSTSVDALLTAGMGAGWNPLPLGSFSLEIRNGIATKPFAEPPGVPILRISAVRAGSVALRDSRFHRPSEAGNEHSYLLKNRDLLFIRFNGNSELVAACGMVRGLQGPCVYPDKLIRIRLDESRALPEFVEIAMSSASARDQLSRFIKTAAGQHGISRADLKSIAIPLPPMTTQLEIVQTAARTQPVLKIAAQEATRAVALLGRLEASILARAFRGELVSQEPSDFANPPAISPALPATRRRARALA